MFQDGHIVERRRQENQIDFGKGVATALLLVTFVEDTTDKAFQALVDDRTEVSIETGLRAAEKLQAVLDGHPWVVGRPRCCRPAHASETPRLSRYRTDVASRFSNAGSKPR